MKGNNTTTMRQNLLPPIDDEAFSAVEEANDKIMNDDINNNHCHNRCSWGKCCNDRVSYCRINSKRDSTLCCLVSGALICMFTAIIVPVILNILLDMEVNEQVVISSTSSPNYPAWQTNVPASPDEEPAISINYLLYFFDTQNPNEVLNGAKPVLVQRGPYAFQEWYNKFDVQFTDDGDTVTYQNQRYYTFNPEQTAPGLSLNDKVTLPYPTIIAFENLFAELNETIYLTNRITLDDAVERYIDRKIHGLEVEIEQQKLIYKKTENEFFNQHNFF